MTREIRYSGERVKTHKRPLRRGQARRGYFILFLWSLNNSVPRDTDAIYSEHGLHWDLLICVRSVGVYIHVARSDPKHDQVHVTRFSPAIVLVCIPSLSHRRFVLSI